MKRRRSAWWTLSPSASARTRSLWPTARAKAARRRSVFSRGPRPAMGKRASCSPGSSLRQEGPLAVIFWPCVCVGLVVSGVEINQMVSQTMEINLQLMLLVQGTSNIVTKFRKSLKQEQLLNIHRATHRNATDFLLYQNLVGWFLAGTDFHPWFVHVCPCNHHTWHAASIPVHGSYPASSHPTSPYLTSPSPFPSLWC